MLQRIVSCHRVVAIVLVTVSTTSRADDPPPVPRGYSIPLIDLADQENRQVVVDREEGQYLGHPTTVLLEDGRTILAVYPKGHGRGAIVLKRSTDGGLHWSDRLPGPENWATSKETPTIHRVVDPQGTRRLILFSGLYPIRMAVSEDDGATWTPLEPIGDFGGIVAMASVERLKNGDYMALFHDDGRFLRDEGKVTKFRVYKTISKDGGLTWGQPEVIAEHPEAHLCEPGLIRSPDGNQIAVLLRENSRKFNSFVIFSDDEGKTWTEPRELPGALTGDRHVGKYGPDGRLFVSFRDTTYESPTRGDWVGWVGTYEDILEGREGQYRVRLMDNTKGADCAYPGVEVLPDGTFVTTTYGHWDEGEETYIVSFRFTLAELDALAKNLSRVDTTESKAGRPQDIEALLSGRFRWAATAPLVSPADRPDDPCHAVKDPTVVHHDGRWHHFCTIRSRHRTHQIEYSSFTDWEDADRAERHVLKLTDGYFCAPQVFYFAPHRRWYLIYQVAEPTRKPALQPAFSTTEDLADPDSWTEPTLLFDEHPDNVTAWIDFWVICDERKAHMFFTSLDGRMWRSETDLEDFPGGWDRPRVVLEADIFEASHTYRLKGLDRYLTVVEAQGDGGRRYYKAYVAERLDGAWEPLAATPERPFAGPVNVRFEGEPWSDSFRHGELLRAGVDERLEVEPTGLRFLFQGVAEADRRGKPYGEIPWRLGLLEAVPIP